MSWEAVPAQDWTVANDSWGWDGSTTIQQPPIQLGGLSTRSDAAEVKRTWKLEAKHIDEHFNVEQGHHTSECTLDHAGSGPSIPRDDSFADFPFTINHHIETAMQRLPDGTMKEVSVLTDTKIEVRSPSLRAVGTEVIGNIQGISWTARPLKVKPETFLAYFPKLENYISKLKSTPNPSEEVSEKISHTTVLLGHLRKEYAAVFADVAEQLKHGEIRFDSLWSIFVPGKIFFLPCPITSEPRAARLGKADFVRQVINPGVPPTEFWQLHFEYIERSSQKADVVGNAQRLGYAELTDTIINSFDGTLKICMLPAYPIEFYPELEDLKTHLIARAKKWLGLLGMHHKTYHGIAYRGGRRVHTHGRIMLDRESYVETAGMSVPAVTKRLDGKDLINPQLMKLRTPKDAPEPAHADLSEDELILTSPLLYGFSLVNKRWLIFKVAEIDDIVWNDTVFDYLVLPEAQKTLVKSLVVAHKNEHDGATFDDFIEGKGQGLVINIFGNPGVGKSLTAEATSEHLRKPLYVVEAGELGTSAESLEPSLSRIFTISAKWGAVVLIDEADVFLEQRSLHDLQRNSMVAVFLRQLEYFRGILFLTTNRVRSFDVAFQSRIHVALHYQDLTENSKEKIWISFMKKARLDAPTQSSPTAGLTEEQLAFLRSRNVNGRQIKNVVRTASAIATSKGDQLSYEDLVQVLDIMDSFDLSSQTTSTDQIVPI